MTQLTTFDNGTQYPCSTAVRDTLMRATFAMTIRGMAQNLCELSIGTEHLHPIVSLEVSGEAAQQLTRDIEETHSDGPAGNPR
jgi:hypothetical protein